MFDITITKSGRIFVPYIFLQRLLHTLRLDSLLYFQQYDHYAGGNCYLTEKTDL